MDRRRFLQMCGGGVVATATMAEVGFFAEFMAWLKRKPVWSFPSKPAVVTIGSYADFISISDLATVYYDRVFIESLKCKTSVGVWEQVRPLPPPHNEKAIKMFQYAIDPCGIDS
jgi:hypothetical protein